MSSQSTARLKKPNPHKGERPSLDLNRPAMEQNGNGFYSSDSRNASRSALDVAFSSTRRGYHARSTSGASQAGSFVHPFHQAPSDVHSPRPYTPPLATTSHHGSFVGSDYSASGHALQESDDFPRANIRSHSTLSNYSAPQSGLPALRLQTKLTSSRLNQSSPTTLNSPYKPWSPDFMGPAESASPMSGLRSSMDRGFRIRSRSDLDANNHQDSIRELRRQFDEKERIKEEKAAREEVKAREKQNLKEARQHEKQHRQSSASDSRRSNRSRSDLAATVSAEKAPIFVGQKYDSTPFQRPPISAENLEPPRPTRTRSGTTTKRKTHSAWTSFVMWLRTRILRMSGSRK